MWNERYSYDEIGGLSSFFCLFINVIVLLSLHLSSLLRSKQKALHEKMYCKCNGCLSKRNCVKGERSRLFPDKQTMVLYISWLSFILISLNLVRHAYNGTLGGSTTEFDPFEILGVDKDATKDVIRRQYKLLTVKYHPDRVFGKDKEASNDKFIRITKAYKILTDEEARIIYENTGNPDGIRQTKVGMALPKFLFESPEGLDPKLYSCLIIIFYGLVFGVLLPFLVKRAWISSKSKTKFGVFYSTMAKFYMELKKDANIRSMIEILCKADEFHKQIKWCSDDFVQIRILASDLLSTMEKVHSRMIYIKINLDPFIESPGNCSLILLLCHLYRIPICDDRLVQKQKFIVKKSFSLLYGLLNISIIREWLQITSNIIVLYQMLSQALPDPLFYVSSFSKIPLDSSIYKDTSVFGSFNMLSIDRMARLRSSMLLKEEHIGEYTKSSVLDDIKDSLYCCPLLTLLHYRAEVSDGEDIAPGSLITLNFYFVYIPSSEEEDKTVENVKKNWRDHISLSANGVERNCFPQQTKEPKHDGHTWGIVYRDIETHAPYLYEDISNRWISLLTVKGVDNTDILLDGPTNMVNNNIPFILTEGTSGKNNEIPEMKRNVLYPSLSISIHAPAFNTTLQCKLKVFSSNYCSYNTDFCFDIKIGR